MIEQLKTAARTALTRCMGLQPGEKLLVVTDTSLEELGKIFFHTAQELGAESMIMEMYPRASSGEEPPQTVAKALEDADVALLVTEKSLSHTSARKRANEKGVRVASLPGLTADMMARTLNADYDMIAKLSERIGDLLTGGKKARLTGPAGTDILLNISGRPGQPDTGIYHQKGCFGNLPAGEAYIAPMENTSQGIIVFDGSMSGVGKLSQKITVRVENGYAVEISGGREADRIIALLDKHGREARNIAELGIGTNHEARLTGNVLEDEKILGTVHIALGDNHAMGGMVEVASHLDGVILNPTLEIDGYVLLRDGKLVG
jgi:leucyl aminopeptidase (aminopeptidase T)